MASLSALLLVAGALIGGSTGLIIAFVISLLAGLVALLRERWGEERSNGNEQASQLVLPRGNGLDLLDRVAGRVPVIVGDTLVVGSSRGQDHAAIVGRRGTFGAPFRNLDKLEPDDPIVVTTTQGQAVYRVVSVEQQRIDTSDARAELLGSSSDDRLTLLTSADVNPRNGDQATVVVAKTTADGQPSAQDEAS